MALSDYELRVLRETEDDLARLPPSSRLDRFRWLLVRQWRTIVLAAVAVLVTALAAVLATAPVAALLASLAGALAGYAVCASRKGWWLRRR